MNDSARRVADNLAQIRSRLAAAAQRSGRTADAVTLVAVTKYVAADVAAALVAAGCRDLGESRPQELWAKADALADPAIRWHLVGHLQRNKLRRTLPLVHLVHSVDRLPLLQAIEAEAAAAGLLVDVLVEVNVSGDACKTGLPPDELEALLEHAAALDHVRVRGLMAMAALQGGTTAARRNFQALRQLRDRLAPHFAGALTLDELSMGMSDDFEVAIEEGATLVRTGSVLFEGLDP